MDKLSMREYLATLETRIEDGLKWKRESRIENGSVVQLEWQFEQSHIIMDVFWHDGKERINVYCFNPHLPIRKGSWKGLNDETSRMVMNISFNFAQIVMHKYRE